MIGVSGRICFGSQFSDAGLKRSNTNAQRVSGQLSIIVEMPKRKLDIATLNIRQSKPGAHMKAIPRFTYSRFCGTGLIEPKMFGREGTLVGQNYGSLNYIP